MKPALATVGPFFLLFALLYAAFGAASPFLPALMESKVVTAEQIGLMFGAATAIRLISAPLAGRIADQTHAVRATLEFAASPPPWRRLLIWGPRASGRCLRSVCSMPWCWRPPPILPMH